MCFNIFMEVVLRPASQKAIYRKQGTQWLKKKKKIQPPKTPKEPQKLQKGNFLITATKT